MAAAQAAFHATGYDALGVADLCRLLSIKPPSLYAAYGCKRALFDRAVARYGADSAAEYGAACERATTLAGLRREVLETALGLFLRDGGVGCLVLSTLASTGDADLRAALCAVMAEIKAAMATRARALGASEAEAAAEVAAIVVGMMGLSAAARAGMAATDLRAALDRIV